MSKTQFNTLLSISVLLIVLIMVNGYLQLVNQEKAATAQRIQNYILQARQVDAPLQNLVTRMANDSDKEPRLRDLMAKHGVKATLNVDGQERQYP